MSSKRWGVILGLVALTALSACAPKRALIPAAVTAGPDEFAIVPAKPLEAPESFAALPTPTPGGSNLTDQTPKADAIVALGGRAPARGGVDGGIVNYVSRYGVDADIRVSLAERDERLLKARKSVPSLPWTKNRYERVYRGQALDPWAEWRRLRAAGVAVPSAPER